MGLFQGIAGRALLGLPTNGPASLCFEGDRVLRPAAGAPPCARAWPSAGPLDRVWGGGHRFRQGTGMKQGKARLWGSVRRPPGGLSHPRSPHRPPLPVHLGAGSALQKMWQVWGPSLLAGPLLSRPAQSAHTEAGWEGHLWRGHLVSLSIGNQSQRESCVTAQGRGHVPSSPTGLTLRTRHAGFREASARVVSFPLVSLHVHAHDGTAGRRVSE